MLWEHHLKESSKKWTRETPRQTKISTDVSVTSLVMYQALITSSSSSGSLQMACHRIWFVAKNILTRTVLSSNCIIQSQSPDPIWELSKTKRINYVALRILSRVTTTPRLLMVVVKDASTFKPHPATKSLLPWLQFAWRSKTEIHLKPWSKSTKRQILK